MILTVLDTFFSEMYWSNFVLTPSDVIGVSSSSVLVSFTSSVVSFGSSFLLNMLLRLGVF
ncbi:hypothetical protein [Reichenbachiella sp.]